MLPEEPEVGPGTRPTKLRCGHPIACLVRFPPNGSGCKWCLDLMRLKAVLDTTANALWPFLVEQYAEYVGGEKELCDRILTGGKMLILDDSGREPEIIGIWRNAVTAGGVFRSKDGGSLLHPGFCCCPNHGTYAPLCRLCEEENDLAHIIHDAECRRPEAAILCRGCDAAYTARLNPIIRDRAEYRDVLELIAERGCRCKEEASDDPAMLCRSCFAAEVLYRHVKKPGKP